MSYFKIPVIEFSTLYNESSFQELKKDFLMHDYYFRKEWAQEEERPAIDLQSDTIDYKKSEFFLVQSQVDENTWSVADQYEEKDIEIITLTFFDDYLLPAIKLIPGSYKRRYYRMLKSFPMRTEKEEVYFAHLEKEVLNEVDNLQEAAHLSQEIVAVAVEQVYQYIDFLDSLKDRRSEEKMIPWKLNRIQVIGLFHLFRLKDGKGKSIIDSKIKDKQLGKFIEEHFYCKGNKKMPNPYKELNEFSKAKYIFEVDEQDPEKGKQRTPNAQMKRLLKIKGELEDHISKII